MTMSERHMRIAMSLVLGGVTGFGVGLMLKDPAQGTIIGLVLGGVFGFFFDKQDSGK